MEETVSERLRRIIDSEGLSARAFAEKLNISQQVIFNYLSGRSPNYSTLQSIATTFVDINLDWLITGNGSMFKSEVLTTTNTIREEGTPLLPVEAWGGSLSGSSIAILAEQCKKYNVPISNIDYLIPIAGDSMMPDYCPGDVVAIKRVNERSFIEWGKVYVLDTCNGVVIKEVQPSEKEGRITCVSRNMPTKYKPFEINLCPEDFYGMYAVKGTVRIS